MREFRSSTPDQITGEELPPRPDEQRSLARGPQSHFRTRSRKKRGAESFTFRENTLASYVRDTPETLHEFRVEQWCSGTRGIEHDELGRLIVEAERELQAVGGDLRGRKTEMEDRPRTGHRRRGVLFGGHGDVARGLRDPMEAGRLTARLDLLAVDIQHRIGSAGALDFTESKVQRRLVSACREERGGDLLRIRQEGEIRRVDVDR